MMPTRLRDKNFAAMLEALIEYAVDGGGYSFVSDGDDKRIVMHITVDDQKAFTAKHLAAMDNIGFTDQPGVMPTR